MLGELFLECNSALTADALPDLPDFGEPSAQSWAKVVKDWAAAHGLNAPSKVAVVNRLVEQEGAVELNPEGKAALLVVHGTFVEIFNPGGRHSG
ncbi:MAG: hypothetical protein NVS3B1_19460 [Marmoricola sp.]